MNINHTISQIHKYPNNSSKKTFTQSPFIVKNINFSVCVSFCITSADVSGNYIKLHAVQDTDPTHLLLPPSQQEANDIELI